MQQNQTTCSPQRSDILWKVLLCLDALCILESSSFWKIHTAVVLWLHKDGKGFPAHASSFAASHSMRGCLQKPTGVNLSCLSDLECRRISRNLCTDQRPSSGLDVQTSRWIGTVDDVPTAVDIHGRQETGDRSVVVVPLRGRVNSDTPDESIAFNHSNGSFFAYLHPHLLLKLSLPLSLASPSVAK